MPQKQEIIVDVSPIGEITIETKGFSGNTCLKASQALKDALGDVTKMVPTAEMNKPLSQTTSTIHTAKNNQ